MSNELERAVERALLACYGSSTFATNTGYAPMARRLIANLNAQGIELTLWVDPPNTDRTKGSTS